MGRLGYDQTADYDGVHFSQNSDVDATLTGTVSVILVIFICVILYPCCSWKGRRRFMRILKWCFRSCCCRIDCVAPLSVNEAMSRYEESPLLQASV